eukprot:UN02880
MAGWPCGKSHNFVQTKIGRELVSRGHEVVYVMSDRELVSTVNTTGLKTLVYEAVRDCEEMYSMIQSQEALLDKIAMIFKQPTTI